MLKYCYTVGILQNYIQKTLSKNRLRMLLTFNYFLIDVKQIIYLSTVFAAQTEVMGTMAKFQNTKVCLL
jgi:hypothetical protein